MFKTVKRIIDWCGEFKGKLYLGFVMTFFSHIFAALPLALAAYTVGLLIESQSGGAAFDAAWIWKTIVIQIVLVLLRFLFDYLRARLQEPISYQLTARDRLAVGDALKRVSLGYFQTMSTGNILNSITTGLSTLENMGIRMIDNFIGGYLNFLVIFVCLAVCSPVTALIALAAAALSLGFMLIISHYSSVNAPVEAQANRDMTGAVIEYARGLAVVKSFGKSGAAMESVTKAIGDSKRIHLKIEWGYVPANALHLLTLKCGSVSLAFAAAMQCLNGQMDFSVMLMFVFFSFSIFASLEPISDSAHTLGVIDDAMDQLDALRGEHFIDADGHDVKLGRYDIRFDHVDFGYDKRKILKDVSFTIPEKTSTAIVGPSGSGKTTISASACTTIYVGGDLVEEGTPFVARTEDYGSDYNKLWFISESGKWKQGDHYVGCPEYGPFEWDFTHDSYRFTYFTNDIYYDGICPECGEKADHYSYTEFGTNEKGVSVSATETLYGNEKVTEADPYRDAEWAEANKSERIGIEETDIPTIILAEASSAREGVKLLLDIYENYGCVAASGVFVCDKDEAWYVENCSGTQYVAIKLNDNMIFLEPNMAVIGRVDLDDENVIASKDLIAVAKKAGTFVGDEAKNIIDFRASYARISEKMDQRMIDGLNYLNATYKYDSDALVADNTKFTISNLDASDKLVALYTNIKADRKLDKDDVFGYYKLSSIGKASNQEIEIFQLFKDRPVETATVGWVGVGNMSYNVFVPYYPMLIDGMYKGYQVSTASAKFTTEKPDTFCTYGTSWAQDAEGNWQRVSGFKAYPSNWKDSYYFTFEGLGGYIANAEKITGAPLKAEAKTYVADKLAALQQELYEDFVTTDELAKASDARALATENGKAMAEKAHKLGVELVEYITKDDALEPGHFTDVKAGAYYEDAVKWAVDKAVTSGKTVTTFAPNESCTRAQAVTFLWRAAGSPEPTASEMAFTDVKADSYYYKAVLWAVENKITSGMSDTLFAPDATCSRSQIVTFLYRMQNSPESKAENPFTDVKADAYYANAVLWAVENGVTTGASATTFDPAGDCTRGQIVTFLYRCLSK